MRYLYFRRTFLLDSCHSVSPLSTQQQAYLYTVSNVPAYDKKAAAMSESPTRRSIMASNVPIDACHRTNSPARPLTSLSALSSLSWRVTKIHSKGKIIKT